MENDASEATVADAATTLATAIFEVTVAGAGNHIGDRNVRS